MRVRLIVNVAMVCAAFALTVGALLAIIPHPRRAVDYMVAGSVGTVTALIVVFLIAVLPMANKREIFFRKRVRRHSGELS